MKRLLLAFLLFVAAALAQGRHVFMVKEIQFETVNGGTNVMVVGGTHTIIPAAGRIENRAFGFRVPLAFVAPLLSPGVVTASQFWKQVIARAESATNISADGAARGVIIAPWPVTMEAGTTQ